MNKITLFWLVLIMWAGAIVDSWQLLVSGAILIGTLKILDSR